MDAYSACTQAYLNKKHGDNIYTPPSCPNPPHTAAVVGGWLQPQQRWLVVGCSRSSERIAIATISITPSLIIIIVVQHHPLLWAITHGVVLVCR